MKLGMPTLIEFGTLEQNIWLAKELELDFIELNMNLPICTPEAVSSGELLKLHAKSGIGFTVHLPEELDLVSIHPPIRSGHIARCAETIRWASEAGISILNMHFPQGIYFTLPGGKVYINERYEEDFVRKVRDSFDPLYELARENGVKLCIENTMNFQLPFVRRALDTLSQNEGFALTWDVGHDERSGRRDEAVFRQYAGRIEHLHLQDANGQSDHQPLFTGTVPIMERIAMAEERDLSVVVEVKTAEALTNSVRALRKEIRKLGG